MCCLATWPIVAAVVIWHCRLASSQPVVVLRTIGGCWNVDSATAGEAIFGWLAVADFNIASFLSRSDNNLTALSFVFANDGLTLELFFNGTPLASNSTLRSACFDDKTLNVSTNVFQQGNNSAVWSLVLTTLNATLAGIAQVSVNDGPRLEWPISLRRPANTTSARCAPSMTPSATTLAMSTLFAATTTNQPAPAAFDKGAIVAGVLGVVILVLFLLAARRFLRPGQV